MMTNGLKTSEFWLSAIILVSASILTALGHLSDGQWTVIVTGVTGAYGISRGIAKVK